MTVIEDRRRPNPAPDEFGPFEFSEPPRHTFTHPWSSTFRYAWAGITYTWRTQRNFRVEVGLGTVAFALSLALGVNPAPILLCCALVLALEMANTAFEAVVDLAAPTYHPLAKIAKDVAAGAVLIAAMITVLVGLVTLGPAILRLLGANI